MIDIRVKNVIMPDTLKRLKGITADVNDYIYNKIDWHLTRAMHRVADNYLYTKLNRESGKLKKSMKPEKRKINQYASDIGFYFDYRIAPHASTLIREGDAVIPASKGKKMTIPVRGGPADVKGRRLKARTMGLSYIRGTGTLWKGNRKSGTPYFILRDSVVVKKTVDPDLLRGQLMIELEAPINKLAMEAINKKLQ